MTLPWSARYAQRAAAITASEIRELLKIVNQPDIISFAGGIPTPELFPYERLDEAYQRILSDHACRAQAFQYSISEGYPHLREFLSGELSRQGIAATPDNILITNGSQQALEFLGKLLLDPGDRLIVESPSYLGALQAFSIYQPHYLPIPMDDDGICVDQLEAAMQTHPAMLYTVPNFQNPSGITLASERRQTLLQMAHQYGVPIIEDDAYGQLRYEGEHLPALIRLDSQNGDGVTIYLGTFSKTLVPGLRVGWVVAPQPVIRQLVLMKQASDLHSSTINQMVAYDVARDILPDHVAMLCEQYRQRRDAMLTAMERHFPPGVCWSRPQGGLFIWVELPPGINAKSLLEMALVEEKVAFVPGEAFFADRSRHTTCRLSFSAMDVERIEAGISRLGSVLRRVCPSE